jgi:catechol 2,3-dioxygenase-like lactoylglutathione lyase family enzyme
MGEIVALDGSPLSVAVISVANMNKSQHFYRDLIGLTVHEKTKWSGPDFEELWQLPHGASADAVFCELPGCPVGRVLLLDFDANDKTTIRPDDTSRAYGLFNLNFYTDDIHADTEKFKSKGFKFWSDPTHYKMSGAQGAPTEVIFNGPDGVAINLVELTGDDPKTRVGQMRAYVQEHGRTPAGYTPVVTTSHVARDLDKAVAFYETVLKSGILIDEILGSPQQNNFLGLPKTAKTAVKFMQGNHMFGKIALSSPVNYECDDLVPTAHAPNIGYIAQMFEVNDLDYCVQACADLEAETYAPRGQHNVPGLGLVDSITVRNPGSGALQLIFRA